MSDSSEPGPRAPDRQKPGLAVRIATPLIVLLLGLVVVEVGLRVMAPIPYSSKLWWLADGHVKARLDPDQQPTNVSGNEVEINTLGFRGPEPSWAPAPGTLRIVALGGSSTFCYDASDDAHTWPALLQAKLRKRLDVAVEVINLGLPGYDTSNSKVNYLFTGRALDPHVVLVYHTWNDMKFLRLIDRTEGTPRWVLSGRDTTGTNASRFARVFRELQLVQRVSMALYRASNAARENEYTALEQEGSDAHAPASDRAWAWFERNFVDITRFVREDGALPVLISQATLVQEHRLDDPEARLVIANDFQRMTLPRLAQSWRRATETIRGVAERERAIYIDGYAAVPADLEHLKDHVHLLDPGLDRLAEGIASALLADDRFRAVVDSVR